MSVALVIFIATLVASLAGLYVSRQIIARNIFRPYWLQCKGQDHTLFTSGLVHKGFGQRLFNTMSFLFFACPLEQRLGTVAYLAV